MNSIKVALSGKRFSGKSSAAAVFERFGFYKVSLAYPLKREVAELNGVSLGHLFANKEQYRAQLQQIGQARREADKDYWLKKLEESVAPFAGTANLVLDDLRFRNEAEYLKQRGWWLVRLHANAKVRAQRASRVGADPTLDLDESETDLDEWDTWDVLIEADDPMPIYQRKVQRALAYIVGQNAGWQVKATWATQV